MESKFQGPNGADDTNVHNNINRKKSTMTLNVNGLWDVLPRLDHYR